MCKYYHEHIALSNFCIIKADNLEKNRENVFEVTGFLPQKFCCCCCYPEKKLLNYAVLVDNLCVLYINSGFEDLDSFSRSQMFKNIELYFPIMTVNKPSAFLPCLTEFFSK